MATLFISDLHLHANRPAATDAFIGFLENDARGADALYILGDLYEIWFGDDQADAHDRRVTAALAEFTRTGVPCFFLRGNRDYMIGTEWAADAGVTLLPGPTLIYVGGESVLVSHGDELCTDDVSYQRYRNYAQNPAVQRRAMLLPAFLRHWIGNRIRNRSIANAKHNRKRPEITDVNEQAVMHALRSYAVLNLLHGHTHRPAIHELDLDGESARRIVLGDWYEQASILSWDESGPQLRSLAFA
jgi:UDP-2,3-diacylglucosamine hydrolase